MGTNLRGAAPTILGAARPKRSPERRALLPISDRTLIPHAELLIPSRQPRMAKSRTLRKPSHKLPLPADQDGSQLDDLIIPRRQFRCVIGRPQHMIALSKHARVARQREKVGRAQLRQRCIHYPAPVRRRATNHLVVQRAGQHHNAPAKELATSSRHPIDFDASCTRCAVERDLEQLQPCPLDAGPYVCSIPAEPNHPASRPTLGLRPNATV